MELQKRLASDISRLAKENGVTAYSVAKKTGINMRTVYAIFNGVGNPTLATVQAVYDCLDALPQQEKAQ